MVEKTNRNGGECGPRSADGRRFEVFLREDAPDPMRHVGTVAAPTPDVAHEEASKLFGWYARDIWVTPAAEVHRYSAERLGRSAESADPPQNEDGTAQASGSSAEPRVREETEGTPFVRCGGVVPEDDRDDEADGRPVRTHEGSEQ